MSNRTLKFSGGLADTQKALVFEKLKKGEILVCSYRDALVIPTHLSVQTHVSEPIAQLVEHITFNDRVDGSNPSGLTTYIKSLGLAGAFFLPPL